MHRLLIVDDEIIMTEELDALLTDMGYGVVGKAFSGEEAVSMARKLLPDLIIMDIVMSGAIDGIDAAKTIKEELHIPFIFMTGYSDEGLVEKAKVLDPYGYVIKPFNDTQLRSAVELALYKKEAIEALEASQAKLRRLSTRMLEAEEGERKRISMELHDQLGQNLSLLSLKIDAMHRKLKAFPTDLIDECKDISTYLKQIIEDTRRLARELSPRMVEDLGLSAALRWMIEEAGKHLNVQTDIDVEDIDPLLSAATRVWVYRIFQEAISNITKHAHAGRMAVRVKRSGDKVEFSIKDDGEGFDIEKITGLNSTEKGLGLATMEERVKMLGGRFMLSSDKGKGTEVGFSLPIHQDKRGKTNGELQNHTGG